MAFSMSDLLTTVSPDYTAVFLNIAPHNQMGFIPVKTQVLKYKDDNSALVIGVNSVTKYRVTLQWTKIPVADAEIIMELWVDPAKADGVRRTFVWTNPAETSTNYTARFITAPVLQHFSVNTYQSIDQIQLLIEGNYVP